ncbi:MAG: peptide deformylase [Bacteroidota bacterium]
MILPIYAYGHGVLKKKAKPIEENDETLKMLIENMWETMYNAKGVGLAAPQIGQSLRLFLVDTVQVMEEEDIDKGIKQAFINAEIVEESGNHWAYEEGCLSIPDIRADVERQDTVTIKYLDENFEEQTKTFDGMNARVIQHEYDHIEGILFTEHIKPLKKRLIKRRLENIRKGKINPSYPLRFPKK